MPRKERVRETLKKPLTAGDLATRARDGWRPVAVEWERAGDGAADPSRTEVPYGLRAGDDPHRLEVDPAEMDVLRGMLTLIVQDRPLSEVAAELDRRGHRRRDGGPWTQSHVFEMLPRVIEVSPDIYASDAWKREKPPLRQVI
ncbi:MAG: hypothetical protein AAGD06_23470 [Acidobacteriota bacterium]